MCSAHHTWNSENWMNPARRKQTRLLQTSRGPAKGKTPKRPAAALINRVIRTRIYPEAVESLRPWEENIFPSTRKTKCVFHMDDGAIGIEIRGSVDVDFGRGLDTFQTKVGPGNEKRL